LIENDHLMRNFDSKNRLHDSIAAFWSLAADFFNSIGQTRPWDAIRSTSASAPFAEIPIAGGGGLSVPEAVVVDRPGGPTCAGLQT
jgi:hypothetical protein